MGADDYQAKFMASGALYYDKLRAPRIYHLLFLLPLAVVLASAIAAVSASGPTAAIGPAISLLILPIAWLLFSVLRITVTREEVYVQYGLFGPKIAIRDIEHAAAVDYDWKRYGGWGIRYGRDGSIAYNMMGDGGRAVEIVYRKNGKAKPKKVLIASPDPVRLASAINEARALAAGSQKPARIETEAAPAADEITREAEAEAEAIAAEVEAEAKRQG
ncbi:Hypothetical protein A7982_09881 [Minicystis rosea]|nr:Hypothetical protein A7982_09881 [Minicystis rosea]